MDNGGDALNLQEVKAFGRVASNTPVQQLATLRATDIYLALQLQDLLS